MRVIRAVVLLWTLSGVATAQTFVVDVDNGPGTQFTSIATAVANVPDGAVLLVRAGVYQEFTIGDRSLTVLGEPGVVVQDVLGAPIRVNGLSAGRAVTLRSLSWTSVFAPTRLQCTDCAGTVVIDDCIADSTTHPGMIVLYDCERVFVRRTRLEQRSVTSPAVESSQSNVVLSECDVLTFHKGIEQWGGRMHVSACHLESNGGNWYGSVLVHMHGGELLVNGDTTLVGSPNTPTPAVAGVGHAAIDASTVLQGIAVPSYTAGIAATIRAIPRLDAATQALGGTATATLHVPLLALGALLVGFPASPRTVPWAPDPLWLDGAAAVRAFGTTPTLTHTYPVPNSTGVLGIQIAWQGAALSFGSVTLSNPSVYAHH